MKPSVSVVTRFLGVRNNGVGLNLTPLRLPDDKTMEIGSIAGMFPATYSLPVTPTAG